MWPCTVGGVIGHPDILLGLSNEEKAKGTGCGHRVAQRKRHHAEKAPILIHSLQRAAVVLVSFMVRKRGGACFGN